MFLSSRCNERSFFGKMYRLAFTFPIGKLYSGEIGHIVLILSSQRVIDYISNQLFQEALKPLLVTLLFKDSASENFDNMYCWTVLRCSCCKKYV